MIFNFILLFLNSMFLEDKGIFGFGYGTGYQSLTNLVSNTGVVAADTAGVGTARSSVSACQLGGI